MSGLNTSFNISNQNYSDIDLKKSFSTPTENKLSTLIQLDKPIPHDYAIIIKHIDKI